MARIRTVKPEFFRSRSIARCSKNARLTFIGLWCEADDHGCGIADARVLKGAIWPLDDDVTPNKVEIHLQELAETGHIVLYFVHSERYYGVSAWESHQSAAYRRGEAKYPPPPGDTILHDDACKEMQESAFVGKGKEGKGSPNSGSGCKPDFRAEFDGFWIIYPKKDAKAQALAKYQAQRRKGTTPEQLLEAASNYAKNRQGKDSTYTMQAKRFLGDKDEWQEWLDGATATITASEAGWQGVSNGDRSVWEFDENED